ncbi:hypothetical protein Tco_0880486, partial [Tanacetum coccineum]
KLKRHKNLGSLKERILRYLSLVILVKNVAYEAVHKEFGDSLVRDATTASSLEVEQDNGNITKTQSKATPYESSSLGTTSGDGPRCQETMGHTIANDSLLARGNTLQSDEDSLKLNELMELCTNLQNRVLDLEKKKTTQQNEIDTRVESSGDEEDLGEDASKQGRRINAIDADEDITLVNVQDDADNEMFDVNALNGEEDKGKGIMIEELVKPMKKKVQIMLDEEVALKLQAEFDEEERLAREKAEKEKEANITLIEEWDDIQAKIDADYQLAERMQAQEQE